MVAKACFALARMTAWLPNVVLPIVHDRFQVRRFLVSSLVKRASMPCEKLHKL